MMAHSVSWPVAPFRREALANFNNQSSERRSGWRTGADGSVYAIIGCSNGHNNSRVGWHMFVCVSGAPAAAANQRVHLHSSCSTLMRLLLVTRFMPADRTPWCSLRQMTVSLESAGPITTHVSSASLPSVTTDGPPVSGGPPNGAKTRENNQKNV